MPALNELIEALATAETDIEELRSQVEEAKRNRLADPIGYLASLIYDNKKVYGSYGHNYGDLGDVERNRAQEIIDIVNGDVGIAENVIVKLRVR